MGGRGAHLLALAVRHGERVRHGDAVRPRRDTEERPDHPLLPLIPPDVVIQDVEEHERVHIDLLHAVLLAQHERR